MHKRAANVKQVAHGCRNYATPLGGFSVVANRVVVRKAFEGKRGINVHLH